MFSLVRFRAFKGSYMKQRVVSVARMEGSCPCDHRTGMVVLVSLRQEFNLVHF